MSEFTCEYCKETFEKIRSEEDCWKEVYEIMPEAINDEMSVLCDDCWKSFIEWFNRLSPSQKKKMRDDYQKETYN